MIDFLIDSSLVCVWRELTEGHWQGQCGAMLTFDKGGHFRSGSPLTNGARFCLRCGRYLGEEAKVNNDIVALQVSSHTADLLRPIESVEKERSHASQGSET